jgi:hypothetical protein
MDVAGGAPSREDVVLLLVDGATGPYPLDRFRVMKGCFLVDQLGGERWQDLFHFRAYDYGPFDSSIYTVRDALKSAGLIEVRGRGRYESYALTSQGRKRVRALNATLGQKSADWVRKIGRWVTSKSFSQIAHEVYARYPKYATRSVLR